MPIKAVKTFRFQKRYAGWPLLLLFGRTDRHCITVVSMHNLWAYLRPHVCPRGWGKWTALAENRWTQIGPRLTGMTVGLGFVDSRAIG